MKNNHLIVCQTVQNLRWQADCAQQRGDWKYALELYEREKEHTANCPICNPTYYPEQLFGQKVTVTKG